MACSLTYDATLSRVKITATALGATVTYATVERSVDGGATYVFVRGATSSPVVSGATQLTTSDYEFPVGQLLTYRVRGYNVSNVLVTTTTCTTTVNQSQVWLKSVARPFLNRALDCVLNPSPAQRSARVGLFDVIDRSYPVALGDVRLGYEYDLVTVTATYDEQQSLDYLLASGDVLYVQPTTTFPMSAAFVAVSGTTVEDRPVRNRDCGRDYRRFELPVTEIDEPESDVVGVTASWYTVTVTYATWSAVVAAHTTWAALLNNLVAQPSEVIRP